jgi:predicted RNA methylase
MGLFDRTPISPTFDARNIANALDDGEIDSCRGLADVVSFKAEERLNPNNLDVADVANSSNGFYGILCSTSAERNFLLSLMTANAVKTFHKKEGRSPVVGELGLGSGINAVAALLVDDDARVIGYEIDPVTISFAESIIELYGMTGKVEIRRQSFLEPGLDGTKLDVVVNENYSTILTREPIFEAANAIHPYTHDGTLFVPHSLDVFVEGPFNVDGGNTIYLGKADLSRENESPVVLTRDLEAGEVTSINPTIKMRYHLIDFRGEKILKPDIPYLELASGPILLTTDGADPNGRQRLTVSFYLDGVQRKEVPLGIRAEIT